MGDFATPALDRLQAKHAEIAMAKEAERVALLEQRERRAAALVAKRQRMTVADGGAGAELEPFAILDETLRAGRVQSAIETLGKIQRLQSSTRDKDGKLRRGKFLAACLTLRWQGHTPEQTADILGCSRQSVTYALNQIRKDAALDLQVKRLTDVIVPLAMDNAARGVMDGDKDYTLRVLDGAGVFKTHKSVQGEVKQTITTLSVQLTMPAHLEGKPLPMPRAGSVLGAPTIPVGLPEAQYLEGVVIRPNTSTPDMETEKEFAG